MKSWILAAAVAVSPCVAHAQDWSYFIDNISADEVAVRGDLYVRNEFAYDPNRTYAITAILLRGGGGQGGNWTPGSSGSLGTAAVGGALGGQTFDYNSHYFRAGQPSRNLLRFGEPNGTGFLNGLGLLGCSVPVLDNRFDVEGYAGSTCAQAGFDGYLKISFVFDGYSRGTPPPLLTPRDFTVTAFGVYRDGPAVFVTPEPAANLLFAAGLAALGIPVYRRRRRNS